MYLASGSCVNFQGDAVVNAANEYCQGGGGVDGAITAAGGPEMAAARAQLPVVEGTDGVRCRTGDAVVTVAGALPVMVCIHAVGPIFPGAHGPDQLDAARMNGSVNESDYQVTTGSEGGGDERHDRAGRMERAMVRVQQPTHTTTNDPSGGAGSRVGGSRCSPTQRVYSCNGTCGTGGGYCHSHTQNQHDIRTMRAVPSHA